jgi:histidine triad (HIT) family protein
MNGCVFCRIVQGEAPADVVEQYRSGATSAERHMTWVIRPLNPVTEGHVLVIPYHHVPAFGIFEELDGEVMRAASRYVAEQGDPSCNIITSVGEEATQTVKHLHVHVVPRHEGDGLKLPWTTKSDEYVDEIRRGQKKIQERLEAEAERR